MRDDIVRPMQILAQCVLLASLASCAATPESAAPPAEGESAPDAPRASAQPSSAAEAGTNPGVVIGRVLEIDEPRAGTVVQLVAANGVMLQATVDESGGYQIDDVPPGEFLLNVVDVLALRTGVMTMKSRGVAVGPGQLVEENFVFGRGSRIHGSIEGIPPGKVQIALFRPGAPRLEGTLLSDRALQIEAAKYLAGSAYIEGETTYQVFDIEPGKYRLTVTLPPDPHADRHATTWAPPLYEAEITVGEANLEWPIAVVAR